MTIPLGPEDINKTARVVDHVSNIASILRRMSGGRAWSAAGADLETIREAARLDERYREFATGEVVRIKDYRNGVSPFSDRPLGKGMATVLIEPLDGDKERSFYAQAHNLEIIEDTRTEADVLRDSGFWRDPVNGNLHRFVVPGARSMQDPVAEPAANYMAQSMAYAVTHGVPADVRDMWSRIVANAHKSATPAEPPMDAAKAHRIANAHKSVARKLENLATDYKETAEDWELLSKSLANLKEQTES
jgi:hypothetical protein